MAISSSFIPHRAFNRAINRAINRALPGSAAASGGEEWTEGLRAETGGLGGRGIVDEGLLERTSGLSAVAIAPDDSAPSSSSEDNAIPAGPASPPAPGRSSNPIWLGWGSRFAILPNDKKVLELAYRAFITYCIIFGFWPPFVELIVKILDLIFGSDLNARAPATPQ